MKKTLTKEELAARLNGHERRAAFPQELLDAAKESKLVIAYAGSDDLICFAGAFTDEADAFNGGTVLFCKIGVPINRCEDEKCPYFHDNTKEAIKYGAIKHLVAYWCGRNGEKRIDELAYAMLGKPTWCFDCSAIEGNFATFDIFDTEDGEREYYCRAAVIDLEAVFPHRSYEQMVM